jgi:light-regulated signal transduction histidine kinase (bacteriophytochrome)
MTPNVEQLLLELEQRTEVLNKEIRFRQQAEFLAHQHMEILESKNKEIRLFANMAAHELQKPLHSLEAGLQTLKNHQDAKVNQSISVIENSVDRLRTLINGYLEYAFIQIDAASFELVSLTTLLEEALQNISEEVQKNKAKINFNKELFAKCPSLLGNTQLLCSVFQELITNSMRYCDKAPAEVEVTLEMQPGICLIAIKDNGLGIHPKFFEQIFWVIKPDQESGGYKRNSIGLSISKKIIEHHGGKIWVSSNIEGGGTTFYISLPIPAQH